MFRRTDFKKMNMIGSGKKNTKIFLVEYLKTGKVYVLKEVEAKNLDKLNEYKEEAVQLSRLQVHPNILQIFGYYFYETKYSSYRLGIISEYLNCEMNLEYIFRTREKIRKFWREDQMISMIYSLIDAFAYLESVGVCHRDIKPTNLFLMDNNEIKIIDFGESKEFYEDDEDEHSTMATIRGTPQYLSPILWEAHVITQAKQIQHNIFKSDVFSAGLVLFQMASLKDVTGFNQKTELYDGERLIRDGLRQLSKMYSSKVTDIIKLMLIYEESNRPNFIELGQIIVGKSYTPRTDLSLIGQLMQKDKNNSLSTGANSKGVTRSTDGNTIPNMNTPKEKSDEEKAYWFLQYIKKHNLKFNMSKTAYWFEYGGNMIAKFDIANKAPNAKWKLIGKYKSTFSYHFTTITPPNPTSSGFYIIGGTDSQNTFYYQNGQITRKASMNIDRSFTSLVYINNSILAIGGYEYQEKNQLSSIECYDIEADLWTLSKYPDLQKARSQANALVYNKSIVYIFGGYNKNYGTLNSIERLNIDTKRCDLIEMKLPVPLRRFAALKITESKILLMGGITRLCKESEATFIIDMETSSCVKFSPLPRGGVIEQEVIVDDIGQVHLFYENNYGTSPNTHVVYNYLDFN